MENYSNLENSPDEVRNESKTSEEMSETHISVEKATGGRDYHDYVPHHSNHGRSNIRTFGIDHEPGLRR